MADLDPPGGADLRRRGLRLILIGLVLGALAIAVSVATYSAAQERGGRYFVLLGPMILGPILVISGLVQLVRAGKGRGPGWHPDPTGRHAERWWDGSRWTSDVIDGGVRGSDTVSGADDPGSDKAPVQDMSSHSVDHAIADGEGDAVRASSVVRPPEVRAPPRDLWLLLLTIGGGLLVAAGTLLSSVVFRRFFGVEGNLVLALGLAIAVAATSLWVIHDARGRVVIVVATVFASVVALGLAVHASLLVGWGRAGSGPLLVVAGAALALGASGAAIVTSLGKGEGRADRGSVGTMIAGGVLAVAGSSLSWASYGPGFTPLRASGLSFLLGKITLSLGIVVVLLAALLAVVTSSRLLAALSVLSMATGGFAAVLATHGGFLIEAQAPIQMGLYVLVLGAVLAAAGGTAIVTAELGHPRPSVPLWTGVVFVAIGLFGLVVGFALAERLEEAGGSLFGARLSAVALLIAGLGLMGRQGWAWLLAFPLALIGIVNAAVILVAGGAGRGFSVLAILIYANVLRALWRARGTIPLSEAPTEMMPSASASGRAGMSPAPPPSPVEVAPGSTWSAPVMQAAPTDQLPSTPIEVRERPARPERWPWIRRAVLVADSIGAIAFAVLALTSARFIFVAAAWAFALPPLAYVVAAAARTRDRRPAAIAVAVALIALMAVPAVRLFGDCRNRLSPGSNLAGCDFAGADLAGFDLKGADLSGANLSNADLAGVNLEDAKLKGADLSGARLARAILREADLSDANLQGAFLPGSVWAGANLSGADLRGQDFSGLSLAGVTFAGADLTEAVLNSVELVGANLDGAKLEGADLTGANLREASLAGAVLDGAALSGSSLSAATLDEASLRGADLTGSNLDGASIQGADLHAARLGEASLNRVALAGSILDEADLRAVTLEGANLRGASLAGADLTGTTLDGATLDGVMLRGASLDDATLIGATGLTDVQLAAELEVPEADLAKELTSREIRLEHRDEILEALGAACRGSQLETAAARGGSGFRPMVILDGGGRPASLSDQAAKLGWEPMAARFGQLVACIEEEKQVTVEVCTYFAIGSGAPGPPTRRLRFERGVRVVEAKTGRVVFNETYRGSFPEACPATKNSFFGGEDIIEGSHLGFKRFKARLAKEVG
jgi:uncharacterized protein YjbI with pentapeptide repeats